MGEKRVNVRRKVEQGSQVQEKVGRKRMGEKRSNMRGKVEQCSQVHNKRGEKEDGREKGECDGERTKSVTKSITNCSKTSGRE
jgi:hypothetical protein